VAKHANPKHAKHAKHANPKNPKNPKNPNNPKNPKHIKNASQEKENNLAKSKHLSNNIFYYRKIL